MSTNAQKTFQQYAVAAGQKNNVDPNFVAAFYYVERGHTGDSANNADAANGTPAAGDGQWEDPAPPVGNGPAYKPPNQFGYYEPYGLSQADKTAYGEDGDGDGQTNLTDLADAMFTAANYLVKLGHASTNMTDAQIYSAAMIYNHSASYAQSIVNIMHVLRKAGGTTVTTSAGGANCSSATLTSNTSCGNISQASGSARILAAAKCWGGIYYEYGGGHTSYSAYTSGCPDPSHPPAQPPNKATGGPQLDGGASGNPSPCGVDCSSLVSLAVDKAFGLNYMWTVQGPMVGPGANYWQSVPWDKAQAGDIVTNSEHVEIIVSVGKGTVVTWGAHDTGRVVGIADPKGTAQSYYPDGAWHWTGPQGVSSGGTTD
jgi:hypothetical protein